MRIRQEEINNALFVPKKDKKEKEEMENDTRTVIIYTLKGLENKLVDLGGKEDPKGFPILWDSTSKEGSAESVEKASRAYAKSVSFRGQQRFFIKKNKYGRFMNPVSGIEEFKHKRSELHRTGHDEFPFREVGYKAFFSYIRFLKTKNVGFLNESERESIQWTK